MQYEYTADLEAAWDDDGIAEVEVTELDLREDLLGNLFSCCYPWTSD